MTDITTKSTSINGVNTEALHATIAAIAAQPSLGEAVFETRSAWLDDRRVRTTVDGFAAAGCNHTRPHAHALDTDIPTPLLGTDQGASPLELALAALGSCIATTLVAHASAKGITLRAVNAHTTGDIDLRGFLNIAKVRVGYGKLQVVITIDSDMDASETQAFVTSGLRFSPVFDLFTAGTAIESTTHKVA